MPRIARIKLENLTYHIICRGNNKMNVFLEEPDYQHYLNIITRYHKKFQFQIYHFVLMPNHVHLLLKAESDISRLMHGINLSYAQYFKKKYNHIGHFWQDRFKSLIVEDEIYLLTVALYIEHNPLRAKLTDNLRNYKFSSYHFYAYGEYCGTPITPDPLFLALSDSPSQRQKLYRDFIDLDIPENNLPTPKDLSPLIFSTQPNIIKEQFISTPEFAQELITTKLVHRLKPKRGRPPKNPQKIIYNLL